jgi:hypothetical protein
MSSKEPSCIHYKHSKGHLAIYGKKMNAEHQFNITEITYASPQNVQEQIMLIPLGKVIEKQLILALPIPIRIQTPWKKKKNIFLL